MRRIATWRPPLWLVVILLGCALVLGSGIGYLRGVVSPATAGAQPQNQASACTESADVCAKFDNFWDVWNLAEERFVDPEAINADDMVSGAINGMLNSLGDQGHTRYLTAEQFERAQEELSGSFEGIGAYVDMEGEVPVIVAPIEGSPAAKAGILPGDVILSINGETTEGLLIDEVVTRIRGPAGSSVTLEVLHPGEEAPVELTIQRAQIDVPAVTWRMLPGDVAHIRLSQFSDGADQDVRQALDAARAQGAKALIMDVRDNPGGIRDQAVSISAMFVPKGEPVLLQVNREGETETYRDPDTDPVLDLPMVVLINGGSASSSEIFAAALQDYDRATVIGVPTAGTGTVLSVEELDDGSAVYLGVEQWQSPKGRYLRREGVTPDLLVSLPAGVRPLTPAAAEQLSNQEILQSPDIQLRRALNALGVEDAAAFAPPRIWAR